jgi:hypothetical protein
MAIEIRETTITTDADATIVQIHIADAPISDETAAFRLTLLAKMPRYKSPYVAQVQREAILEAREALLRIADALLQELPRDANARPKVI